MHTVNYMYCHCCNQLIVYSITCIMLSLTPPFSTFDFVVCDFYDIRTSCEVRCLHCSSTATKISIIINFTAFFWGGGEGQRVVVGG